MVDATMVCSIYRFFSVVKTASRHGGICGEAYFMYAAAGNLLRIPPLAGPTGKKAIYG
jgi:hypothetical protein